jgi:hypothetical protein
LRIVKSHSSFSFKNKRIKLFRELNDNKVPFTSTCLCLHPFSTFNQFVPTSSCIALSFYIFLDFRLASSEAQSAFISSFLFIFIFHQSSFPIIFDSRFCSLSLGPFLFVHCIFSSHAPLFFVSHFTILDLSSFFIFFTLWSKLIAKFNFSRCSVISVIILRFYESYCIHHSTGILL